MSWDIVKAPIYAKWKAYWFATHPPDIAEYSWNYLFTGGKEIRSRLFYELWTYLSPESTPCVELAFAVECIHAASLILDDSPWMDNAAERRGKKTLHLVFSERKALLLCHDVMYMVYLIWNQNKPAHIPLTEWEDTMKDKLQRLLIGQWHDLEKTGSLVELASLKTGILFEWVAEVVAMCLQLDREFWKIWGNHLGILFQWMDDWLDRDEDIQQQNRNAFNEAHDRVLQQYGQLWSRICHGIGPVWFQRPFGQFMTAYFTQRIPLSSTPLSLSLSDLSVPYPTSMLPYFKRIIPLELRKETADLLTLVQNPQTDLRVNGRNVLDFEKSEISAMIREKPVVTLHMQGQEFITTDYHELWGSDLADVLGLLNQNRPVPLTGKQIIRDLLRVSYQLDTHRTAYQAKYMETYQAIKQKLWSMDESEWENQPELVDNVYDEIQQMKEQRGIIHRLLPESS